MRPLFRGESCAINEAGIASSGNPLSRVLDAASGDALHAQQMREGYLYGARPPMGGPMMGNMLRPMMPGGGLEAAWQEAGPMGPGPAGPVLGDAMQHQMRRHMEAAAREGGLGMMEPGFFADGPMSLEGDWAQEFHSARPLGPMAGIRPPGAMMRPPGPDWAADFAAQQMAQGQAPASSSMAPGPMQHGPMGPCGGVSPMEMQAAFQMSAMRRAQQQAMRPAMPVAQQPAPVAAAAPVQAKDAPVVEVAKHPEPVTEEADLSQAAAMVEMLRNSGNPKFANSQFVNFIDKVSKGDLQFKDNSVVDRAGNTVEWDSLYDTQAATASDSELNELGTLWDKAKVPTVLNAAEQDFEKIWKDAMETGNLDQLWKAEEAWLKEHGDDAIMEGLDGQAFMGDRFNMDTLFAGGNSRAEYKFEENNKYLEHTDPLAEAQRLLREGRDREAMLCLEAEVQRNPESSEGWRQLGQLYAEMDQDVEAIQCLRKGHEVDPYNLDSLLALGVSCTNELDQLEALKYLREWIENHETHQVLAQGLDRPPNYEYEAWRQQVTMLFNKAAEANPLDSDVFVALGVMQNINRDYEAAIRALATACRLRPNDHTCWNKLGATLANSGKSDKAVIAYHQGLHLKPNYARSWSNLAIAHSNLGQHKDAARFYLSSLVLNPEATHIWGFLHGAVLNMGDVPDAAKALDERDLGAMRGLIDNVLDPANLPPPSPQLAEPVEAIIAKMEL
eukprot:TRINITY_DN6157_c0_g1_i1.p1 TRINITY_DN6157_c0_g1~~TRINITY_DN6157_c0_g1_i1.p1  ORF type:complete len:761 (-),score=185.40 TRINITY_DN6157_c0_g1_i1:55-2238(-)